MKLNIINIEYKKQYRPKRKSLKVRQTRGFDTETIEGKTVLLCDSVGRWKVIYSFDQILDFLTYRDYSTTLNFFYNLRYDYTGFLKYLDLEQLKILFKTNTLKINDKYIISYIPKKIFSIYSIAQKRHYDYFDLAQFYEMKLQKAAYKYNNTYHQKLDTTCMISDYTEITRNFIIYCVWDALCTKVLADKLQKFCNSLDMNIPRPYSKASLAQAYLFNNVYVPTINKFIDSEYEQALGYAIMAYHGGRFEVSRRGYFEELYVYDLNSAYPYEMTNLIDFNCGKWVKRTTYDDIAALAYIRCNLEITKSNWGCLIFMYRNVNYFPYGQLKNIYITKNEYEFIKDNELGEITILDGWFFYLTDLYYPLRSLINKIYNKRIELKHKQDEREFLLKIILNSLYGKFISVVDEKNTETKNDNDDDDIGKQRSTNLFIPFWAAEITANTRLKLLKELINNDSIIAVATDSLISTEKLNIQNSEEIGNWKIEERGEGIVIGSGVYSLHGEKKNLNKFRGFDTKVDLFDLLEQNKDKTHIKIEKIRPVSLGEVICFPNEFPFDTLNQFCTVEKELNINFDKKRNWEDNFLNCDDILKHNYSSDSKIVVNNRIYNSYEDFEDHEYMKIINYSPQRIKNPRLSDWLKDHEQAKDIIDSEALFDTDIGDNWNTVRVSDFVHRMYEKEIFI